MNIKGKPGYRWGEGIPDNGNEVSSLSDWLKHAKAHLALRCQLWQLIQLISMFQFYNNFLSHLHKNTAGCQDHIVKHVAHK